MRKLKGVGIFSALDQDTKKFASERVKIYREKLKTN